MFPTFKFSISNTFWLFGHGMVSNMYYFSAMLATLFSMMMFWIDNHIVWKSKVKGFQSKYDYLLHRKVNLLWTFLDIAVLFSKLFYSTFSINRAKVSVLPTMAIFCCQNKKIKKLKWFVGCWIRTVNIYLRDFI